MGWGVGWGDGGKFEGGMRYHLLHIPFLFESSGEHDIA